MRQTKHVIIMLEVGGDTFRPNEGREIARILRGLAGRFVLGNIQPGETVHDSTGYPCGEIKVLLTESPS